MEEDSTTGRRSSVATVATMLSINSTNSTISTMDMSVTSNSTAASSTTSSSSSSSLRPQTTASIPSKASTSSTAKLSTPVMLKKKKMATISLYRSSPAACVDLPVMFRELLEKVPGLEFPREHGPILSRHGYTRDIHSALIAAGHGRSVRRMSQCGSNVGQTEKGKSSKRNGQNHEEDMTRKRHAGVLTTGGDEKRSANENDKLEADGDRVLERDKEREREKEHDQDLKTHPRDVDALLAKIMAAGYERRTTFPNVANPVLWAEVGRNVDWLEGMPAAAVLELGVEIFNARIEFLRRAKIAERDEKRAMRRRRLRDGTDGEERKEGGDSGVEVGTACQPPTPSLSPTSTRRSISSSQCSINPSKITGRTARIVDAWVEWREFLLKRGCRVVASWKGYDDELYAPVSKEPREGYRADDEYVEDPLQYQNWWWKGNKKVRRKMKPIASGNGSKAEGRKTPAKK